MPPQRKALKRSIGDGMHLRSGSNTGRRALEEDGCSRVFPSRSPAKSRRCPLVDDEATVDRDEGSNFVDEDATTTLVEAVRESQSESLNEDAEDATIKHNRFFGQDVSLGLVSDVMGKFYVIRSSEPPLIPLCRLLPTNAVRVAESDATWLIPLFDRAGYVKTMGSFIVSLKGRHGETKLVTEKDVEKWDPIWQEMNEEFEANLPDEWKDLHGKFFYVYDGNNRVKTWEKRIKDKYSESRLHHAQVKCQFIEVKPKKEGELILSLDTTNAISRATAVPNLGHELFLFQKFGLANKESIMDRLSSEQRSWMETEIKFEVRHNQGVVPWYSTPCILISQLVWKDKWMKFLTEEDVKLRSHGIEGDELKKKMDLAIKREEEKFRDSGYKYLSIANPIHGEDFFSIIFNRDWEDKTMVGITRDKLYSLCTAKISIERRKELLHMMTLTKLKDPKASFFADYKKMRTYMKQEAYWHGMYLEATILIKKFEVEGPSMPDTFETFYKICQKVHVTYTFSQLLVSMKSASDTANLPDVMYSSKRLVYRWLCDCVKEGIIGGIPYETTDWLDLDDENTMFSPSLREKGLTAWECSNCPWWIEYPLGIVPKQELQLYATFMKDNPSASKSLPTCAPNDETMQGLSSGTKKSKEKQPIHLDDISQNESDLSPLITRGTDALRSTSCPSRVSESIFDRSSDIGKMKYRTCVDALLVDIAAMDDFARLSMLEWFENSQPLLSQREYHRHGAHSSSVARLIFADFPTSLLVHGLHTPVQGAIEIPEWNVFHESLVVGVMEIASTRLADEGFLVTICLAQHLGIVVTHAEKNDLQFYRSWTLDADGGYVHPLTQEHVTDVTIGLFYHKNMAVPAYDRIAGQDVCPQMFPASRSCIAEGPVRASTDYTVVDGVLVRGGAERSKTFFNWLLATFTQRGDYIIDVFAGCGGLGAACCRHLRHCLLLELDFFAYTECLEKLVCGQSLEGRD